MRKLSFRALSVFLTLGVLAFSVHLAKANHVLEYDLNRNGIVDLQDVYEVAKAFGTCPGCPSWDPLADINNDDKVDLKDYYSIVKHFGEEELYFEVPELWMGPAMGLAGCFGAFGLFRFVKRKRQ